MRLTENQLRRIIRSVIKEGQDYLDDPNVLSYTSHGWEMQLSIKGQSDTLEGWADTLGIPFDEELLSDGDDTEYLKVMKSVVTTLSKKYGFTNVYSPETHDEDLIPVKKFLRTL